MADRKPEWAPSDAVQLTPFDARPATQATKDAMLNPEADERHAKLVSVADKLRASRSLVERIEAELDSASPCSCDAIRALIQAAKR